MRAEHRKNRLPLMRSLAILGTICWALAGPALAGDVQSTQEQTNAQLTVLSGDGQPTFESFLEAAGDGLRASTVCHAIGGWNAYSIQNFFQGNVISIPEDGQSVELSSFRVELDFESATEKEITFAVYECSSCTGSATPGVYNLLAYRSAEFLGEGRAYYSSPAFFPAIEMEPGKYYTVAVGWGSISGIEFGRDSATYPKDFEAGRIHGSWGITWNPADPPPNSTVSLSSIYSGGVLSMELCFDALPGVCCIGDDFICQDGIADENACTQLYDGQWTDHGLTCPVEIDDPDPCVQGACCLGEYCWEKNAYACERAGGTWYIHEDCGSPNVCQTPRGSCCLVGGDCVDQLTLAECEAEQGGYNGDYTFCSDSGVQCSETGACCAAGLRQTCEHQTAIQCDRSGGTFKGGGVTCPASDEDPDPCDVEVGACCRYDGVCDDYESEYDCLVVGPDKTPGYWQGANTHCDGPQGECPVLGACCPEHGEPGECADTTSDPEDCATSGFTWHEGQPCQYNACDARIGACCVLGECLILNEAECHAIDGAFQMVAPEDGFDACDGINCGPQDEGACCMGDGNCVVTTAAACTGFFNGEGVPCNDVICAETICCSMSGDGSCTEEFPVECDADGGRRGTLGKDCNYWLNDCDLAACCLETGCEMRDEFHCLADGGTWTRGRTCDVDDDPCAPYACCQDNQCQELSELECPSAAEFHHGVACDDPIDPCNLEPAACCLTNECRMLNEWDCTNSNGVFYATETCEFPSDPCDLLPNEGACCDYEGACAVLTEQECRQQPSHTYMGDDSLCSVNNPCEFGACCDVYTGSCSVTFRGLCEQSPDAVFAGNHTVCDTTTTCPMGTCCSATGECTVATPLTCDLAEGFFEYGGHGTTCSEDPCEVGACCVPPSGCNPTDTCKEVTPDYCSYVGGTYHGEGSVCPVDPPCPVAEGACCKDGVCTEGTEDDCDGVGGDYLGHFTHCTGDTPCDLGACCPGDGGECQDLRSEECRLLGGKFTEGTTCTANGGLCLAPCCFDDGSCQDLLPASCLNDGGLHGLQGVPCDESGDLCTLGACCSADGFCKPKNSMRCEDDDGTFYGVGSVCGDYSCKIGACCQNDGTCTDGLNELQCNALPCSTFRGNANGTYECSMIACDSTCSGFSSNLCGGDYDDDDDVDLVDFAAFQACFGPVGGDLTCECVFDANMDGYVDLDDYESFEGGLKDSGPM